MAFIDDYNGAVQNDTQFRQRLTLALTQVIINNMPPTVPNPTAAQIAVAKRFLLDPFGETSRYLPLVAARMRLNNAALTDDTALLTAAGQVLALNVALAIT